MVNYAKMFFRRIAKDFRQRELLPVKMLFFIQMSTILVLYPYLTIHMRELGINVEETAIMSSVTPVIGLLMPPVAGVLADKIGNFRVLLAVFSALGGVGSLLLLLVPVGRITITYPESVVFGVSCNQNEPLTLELSQDFQCVPRASSIGEINVTIRSCGFTCEIERNELEFVNSSRKYQMDFVNLKNKSISKEYAITKDDIHIPRIISETRNHETLRNNVRYKTAIRKYSENYFYFPSEHIYDLACDSSNIAKCKFKQGGYGLNKTLLGGVIFRNKSEFDVIEKKLSFNVVYIKENGSIYNASCSAGYGQDKGNFNVTVTTNDNEVLVLAKCEPKCIATSPRAEFCANQNTVIELDIDLTFWTYLAVRVFIGIVGGTAYTMFEGAVIAILREYNADYGLQRMYASIGGMISSPLSGWMIDFASRGKGYTDFRPVFFLYAVLKIISAVMMLFINLEFKSPAHSVFADVLAVLNLELISLFTAAFLLGSAWGYIESFLFWLLQDLGGSKSLMGLTITVGGLVGIPILVLSGPLIKKLGHANVIFIGFMTYVVRLIGYSIIYNPWLSLIFEALECLTHSLCFTAAVTYAARLSTVTTDTTIQGIFGGLFYGVGRSAGSLIGGYLIKIVGMRTTFQIFAVTTGIAGIFYLTFYHLYMKRHSKLRYGPRTEKETAENVDLPKNDANAQNEFVDKIKSIPYEDSLTNLAYEDTEGDLVMREDGGDDDAISTIESQKVENKII